VVTWGSVRKTEIHKVHPHGVDCSVVEMVLVLLRHWNAIRLNGVWLLFFERLVGVLWAVLVSVLRVLHYHRARHGGPVEGVGDTIVFVLVLQASDALGGSRAASRVMKKHAFLSVWTYTNGNVGATR